MPSQYSAENVCVSGGGRAALTRAAASLGHINLGHFLPDYTAYEELLDIFKAFTAIPILLEAERGYAFGADDLRREILGRGLSRHPHEQPVQPDGQAGRGRGAGALGRDGARARLHAAPRRVLLALHLPRRARGGCRSRAPRATSRTSTAIRSCIFDGFTKNWRYPGWRVTWALAPKDVVEALSQRGLVPRRRRQQAAAARRGPAPRRGPRGRRDAGHPDRLPRRSATTCSRSSSASACASTARPTGRSTCGASVDGLPPPLNDGMGFFRAALEEKVIVVPGRVLRREPRQAAPRLALQAHVRFSFGPGMSVLEKAVERFERLLARAGCVPSR